MRKSILFLAAVLTGKTLYAQTKWSVGAEVAAATDLLKIDDPGGYLRQPDLQAVYGGVFARYQFHRHLFAEIGGFVKRYDVKVSFGSEGSGAAGGATLQVPLRIGGRFAVWKEHLGIEPFVGYALCFQPQPDERVTGQSRLDDGRIADMTYTTNYPTSTYGLWETGLAVQYRLRKWSLGLRGHYNIGGSNRMLQAIRYEEGAYIHNATQYSRGSFYAIGLTAAYRF